MGKKDVGWDLEGLRINREQITREKEKLAEAWEYLNSLKENLKEEWNSYVSELYLDDLATDTENLRYIINALEELITKLNRIEIDYYGSCEEMVVNNLYRLSSRINPI